MDEVQGQDEQSNATPVSPTQGDQPVTPMPTPEVTEVTPEVESTPTEEPTQTPETFQASESEPMPTTEVPEPTPMPVPETTNEGDEGDEETPAENQQAA